MRAMYATVAGYLVIRSCSVRRWSDLHAAVVVGGAPLQRVAFGVTSDLGDEVVTHLVSPGGEGGAQVFDVGGPSVGAGAETERRGPVGPQVHEQFEAAAAAGFDQAG